jgi:hypothetical protein
MESSMHLGDLCMEIAFELCVLIVGLCPQLRGFIARIARAAYTQT